MKVFEPMTMLPNSILYVEDDLFSREIMQLLAESVGVQHVTIFEDSADFLDRVQAIDPSPDVVLLDIHLQPHDGFTMLSMLRGLHTFRDKPIVALTASVMNEEIIMLRDAGFDGVIGKPIDQDRFADLLGRVFKRESFWGIS
jgi:two-component system cell cycle response regulator DivK